MSSLLPFPSGPDSADPCFDVSDLLQEVTEQLDEPAQRRGVQIEVDAPPYVIVRADEKRVREAFRNLLLVAMDGTSAGGEVLVTVYSEDELVEVEIAEGGADMIDASPAAAEDDTTHRRRIAEVQELLAADGVELDIADCPDGGAAYIVQFPRPGALDKKSRQAA